MPKISPDLTEDANIKTSSNAPVSDVRELSPLSDNMNVGKNCNPRHCLTSVFPPAFAKLSLFKQICIYLLVFFLVYTFAKSVYYILPFLFDEITKIQKHIDYAQEYRLRDLRGR